MYLTSGKNRRLQDEVSGKTSVCNISANFDRRINQDNIFMYYGLYNHDVRCWFWLNTCQRRWQSGENTILFMKRAKSYSTYCMGQYLQQIVYAHLSSLTIAKQNSNSSFYVSRRTFQLLLVRIVFWSWQPINGPPFTKYGWVEMKKILCFIAFNEEAYHHLLKLPWFSNGETWLRNVLRRLIHTSPSFWATGRPPV